VRAWLAIGAALLGGCDIQRLTVELTGRVLVRASRSLESEPDVEVARAALPGQLKTIDGLLETAPRDEDLLGLAALGFLQFAFGFVEDELESQPLDGAHATERAVLVGRATGLYDRSFAFAVRLLARRDPRIRDALAGDAAGLAEELARLDRRSVPGLFYAGAALASAINLNREDPSRAADLPKAIALLSRARALDPRFYHAGPPLILGLVYGLQPRSRGGQPERARRLLEEAIALTDGKYLLARVMLARAYAVSVGDRALFASTLRAVLDAPPDLAPDCRLSNELAKRRAARYLAAEQSLF